MNKTLPGDNICGMIKQREQITAEFYLTVLIAAAELPGGDGK